MKDKDGNNTEDILAQLSNSRTSETVLLSLYTRLNRLNLSRIQRDRALKTVSIHCTQDSHSTEIQKAALKAGFAIVQSDLISSSDVVCGAPFSFLEACQKVVVKYADNVKSCDTLSVSKALEILSHANISTVSKLFHDKECMTFKKVIKVCLVKDNLQLHALSLLDLGLSAPESEPIRKAIMEDKVAVIQLVYPLLFNLENEDVRAAALAAMKNLKLTAKPQPFWGELKERTQKVYSKQMVEMVDKKQKWPVIWQFVVNMFGEELHSGGQLINHMLEVLERAFKHSDFEWTRVQAFECWNTLIDNFKSGLKNKKRIELIMIPLKANNHRIETLASAKLNTYEHLLEALGKDLVSSPDILLSFISFCFGSEKTSIPPVKSYPDLHKTCVDSLKKILMSSCMGELFTKCHKELLQAVGDCFLMETIPMESLQDIWKRVLDLVRSHDGTEVLKNLFSMVQKLVNQAGNGDTSASLKFRRSLSPTTATSNDKQPNAHLGEKIVSVILNSMVQGEFALKHSLFSNRSLYVGHNDVMTGTPSFMFVEWLLTPALMLGAANLPVFRELILQMISLRLEESTGFMKYAQLVLKRLSVFEETLYSNKKLLYKCAADVWCILAKKIVEFIQNEGSINQGNAAEHDFSALYAVLLFPTQNLYVEFDLIEKCSGPWRSLFYEAYVQAALVATVSSQEFCDNVCTRLATASKQSKSPKQLASVYFFLACVLQVASEKFKSSKRYRKVQECVSDIVRELDLPADEELVFSQSMSCVQRCLEPDPASAKVMQNVSTPISSLMRSTINQCDLIDNLCTLLVNLKQAVLFLLQHGESKDTVSAMLQNSLTSGKSHLSQKVRCCVRELNDTLKDKQISEIEDDTQGPTPIKLLSVSAFSPSNRSSSLPKQVPKRLAIQTSPSHNSPGSSKKRLQNGLSDSDNKFVRIETPPKKIILTEHQKEVRRERRRDIPALYQDLSQDTQSMSQDASQDFVALPASPRAKPQVPLNEDAVMDIVDVDESIQILNVKKTKSTNTVAKGNTLLEPKNESCEFTPPAGFVLTSTGEGEHSRSELPITDSNHETHVGKENENISSPKPEKLTKNLRRGAITRSSSNESPPTTRSGKVLKRSSLAPAEAESVSKRKSARKSLPLTCSEDLAKKISVQTILIESDTTDTESVSSVTSDASSTNSKLTRKRGRPPKVAAQPVTVDLEAETERKTLANQIVRSTATARTICQPKDGSDLANETPATDQQCSIQRKETPVKKLIGGKVLTRNRSNSNLDEVVGEKKKEPADLPKSIEEANESISKVSQENIDGKSPRKNSTKTSNGGAVNHSVPENIFNKVPSCNRSKPNSCDNISGGGKAIENVNDAPLEEATCFVSKVVDEYEDRNTKHKLASFLTPQSNDKHQKKDDSCSENIGNTTGLEHGIEESQEIIESSQEPLSLVKPCAVSLPTFLITDKMEIDDVVVVKGPQAGSPYKISPKVAVNVTAIEQSTACRSLVLDESPLKPFTPLLGGDRMFHSLPGKKLCKSALTSPKAKKAGETAVAFDDVLKKPSLNEEETIGTVTDNHEKIGDDKEENPMLNGEVNPPMRNGSMPEWMHEKKNSPSSKPSRHRTLSARSQVFMKSVKEGEVNVSPPKGSEMSPVSSPVQPKKASKTNAESNINTTPIIKRSSRAEKLLGLAQAAAARGGETVLSNAPQMPSLSDRMAEEEGEATAVNANNSNSSHIVASSTSLSISNGTNNVLSSVYTAATTTMASPALQRQGKGLDLDSLKYTPQKCLEDKGLKEEWVRRTPCFQPATPDSSILKRRREEDDVPSPCAKRKRVSFRDPPLSSFLKFNESLDTPGTVFNSDRSADLDTADRIVEPMNADQEDQGCSRARRNVVDKIEDQGGIHFQHSERVTGHLHQNCKGSDVKGPCDESSVSSKLNSESETSVAKFNKLLTENITEDNSKQVKVLTSLPPKPKKRKSLDSHTDPTEDSILRTNDDSISVIEKNGGIEEDFCGHDKSVELSELAEVQTQGSIEDLHHTSSLLSPLYPALSLCSHSIECLTSQLTTPAWKDSLSRELSDKKICTVGHLAGLTEEQLDRLPVKQPKKTTVCNILQNFEKGHDSLRDDVLCGLLKSNSGFSDNNEDRLKEVLRNVSDEDILKTLTELGRKSEFSRHMLHSVQPQDIAAIVAGNESVLRSFPIDSVAETYISAISKSTGQNEKNMKAEELNAMFEWIPNKIILEALFSKIKLSDFVQNLEQKKSNDMLEALLMLIKKPSKQIRKVLLSKMSSLDIAEELDQKKSDDVLEALVCNVKEPSKHLRQVLFSKMSSSAILEELDEKKSEDVVLESLAYNLKKPSRQLKQMFLSKISSVDMVNELDEEKSEQLLEELLFKAKKLSKRCVEVSLPKMSPSDIASELVQTKSENLVEALVCNKGIKDVLLSKMSPSDIAKSARIKETLSMLIEFGQGVLKDADKSLPDG